MSRRPTLKLPAKPRAEKTRSGTVRPNAARPKHTGKPPERSARREPAAQPAAPASERPARVARESEAKPARSADRPRRPVPDEAPRRPFDETRPPRPRPASGDRPAPRGRPATADPAAKSQRDQAWLDKRGARPARPAGADDDRPLPTDRRTEAKPVRRADQTERAADRTRRPRPDEAPRKPFDPTRAPRPRPASADRPAPRGRPATGATSAGKFKRDEAWPDKRTARPARAEDDRPPRPARPTGPKAPSRAAAGAARGEVRPYKDRRNDEARGPRTTPSGERESAKWNSRKRADDRGFGDQARRPRPDAANAMPRPARKRPFDSPASPPPHKAASPELPRLSKRMSELGLCSRREADEWIENSWVSVDGKVVTELGTRVHPNAKITVEEAARLHQSETVTILLHKPMGYVSGQAEDGYEPAALLIRPETRWEEDRLPIRFKRGHLRGLAPAGRLDIDSTGLLVFTQDGRVAKRLVGEDSKVEKEYLVRVEGTLDDKGLTLLNHGLSLDEKPLKPAHVSWQNENQLRFVLREGKKRQIRRMCELVGLTVTGLKRIRIGSVTLSKLPVGTWRYLRPDESF